MKSVNKGNNNRKIKRKNLEKMVSIQVLLSGKPITRMIYEVTGQGDNFKTVTPIFGCLQCYQTPNL